jgi:hypothetical protein
MAGGREPVTYRVTWKSYDDANVHTREFTDIDDGYDFYQHMQKGARGYKVTWEHVEP